MLPGEPRRDPPVAGDRLDDGPGTFQLHRDLGEPRLGLERPVVLHADQRRRQPGRHCGRGLQRGEESEADGIGEFGITHEFGQGWHLQQCRRALGTGGRDHPELGPVAGVVQQRRPRIDRRDRGA